MKFSQRKGLVPAKSIIQIDDIDEPLLNGLWDALTIFYWDDVEKKYLSLHPKMEVFLKRIWHSFFKKPLDTLDGYFPRTLQALRAYFFQAKWYEIYDFIEFAAENYPQESYEDKNKKFIEFCNIVLERELSAYRFVDGKIAQITSSEEINEIETALKIQSPIATHCKRVLDLMSDRKKPDYRNSIKESISAVESMCQLITGDKKATLGQALKKVETKMKLHSALKEAFSKLYGYTNDADGIRHALLEDPDLGFEDAKFMLVTCSAFVNYLQLKLSK